MVDAELAVDVFDNELIGGIGDVVVRPFQPGMGFVLREVVVFSQLTRTVCAAADSLSRTKKAKITVVWTRIPALFRPWPRVRTMSRGA